MFSFRVVIVPCQQQVFRKNDREITSLTHTEKSIVFVMRFLLCHVHIHVDDERPHFQNRVDDRHGEDMR